MHTDLVVCPTCFEEFEVLLPPAGEVPCEVDYDCEVCCRPLRIYFEEEGGEGVRARAQGLAD